MLVALILVDPRFNPRDQHLFNKLIDDGDRFNSDQILLRNMLGIWSELSLLRSAQICSELVFLIRICSENSALSLPFGVEKILSGIWSEYPPHSKDLCCWCKLGPLLLSLAPLDIDRKSTTWEKGETGIRFNRLFRAVLIREQSFFLFHIPHLTCYTLPLLAMAHSSNVFIHGSTINSAQGDIHITNFLGKDMNTSFCTQHHTHTHICQTHTRCSSGKCKFSYSLYLVLLMSDVLHWS